MKLLLCTWGVWFGWLVCSVGLLSPVCHHSLPVFVALVILCRPLGCWTFSRVGFQKHSLCCSCLSYTHMLANTYTRFNFRMEKVGRGGSSRNIKSVLTLITYLSHTHTHTHTHTYKHTCTEFSVSWPGQVSSLRSPSSPWRAAQLLRWVKDKFPLVCCW